MTELTLTFGPRAPSIDAQLKLQGWLFAEARYSSAAAELAVSVNQLLAVGALTERDLERIGKRLARLFSEQVLPIDLADFADEAPAFALEQEIDGVAR